MTKREATAKLDDHKELAARLGYECAWRIEKRGKEWVLTTSVKPEKDDDNYNEDVMYCENELYGSTKSEAIE
jgi:hypothetical protein